jgi:lambda repressor-like predicted transcriptional regulator
LWFLTGQSSNTLDTLIALADGLPEPGLVVPTAAPLLHSARQRHVEGAEVEAIVAAYQGGTSMHELAAQYDLHRHTIAAVLDRAGIGKRPRRLFVASHLEQARQLYVDGWSLMRIGKTLGFDDRTVGRHLNAAGVQLRSPQQRLDPAS